MKSLVADHMTSLATDTYMHANSHMCTHTHYPPVSFMTSEITSTTTRAAEGIPSEDTQQPAEAGPMPGNPLQHRGASRPQGVE